MKFKCYKIADELTSLSLSYELQSDNLLHVNPHLFYLNASGKVFLFVESCWNGYKNRWKYKIASYPDHPKRNNLALVRLVEKAREKGIPTVFWNKEDAAHFDRFIDSAKHFDHIFTVDQNCVERYRKIVPKSTTVDVAMFPVQPKIHNYQGFHFQKFEANFVGSYSRHIHDKRRERQEMLFSAIQKAGMPLTIFDRNSDRKSDNYRYPNILDCNIQPKVSYFETADIYRNFLVSLNVNTIEDSPTMFSRRVVEVLACGGILVSTPSLAMDTLFKDYCHIVHSEDEAIELFQRLKFGASKQDLEMARAGADFVLNNFTWRQFLQKIEETISAKQ